MSVVALEPTYESPLPTAEEETVAYVDSNDEMGKDAFLKLLLTQLQYQDPLNPMEGVEFTAQLAQFTSLEQLYNINENFSSLSTALTAQYNFDTIAMVGKEVKAAGEYLSVADGESTKGLIALESAASELSVGIYNLDGSLIRTLTLDPSSAGEVLFEWDGKDYLGNAVDDGNYIYEVTATDASGSTVTAIQAMQGRVNGVTYDENGEASLLLNNLKVSLPDVFEILEADAS